MGCQTENSNFLNNLQFLQYITETQSKERMVINDKIVLHSSWQTKIFKSRCIKIVFNNEEKGMN